MVRVLDLLGPTASFPLAFAALLHDIGKRPASEIGQRLKLSTEERERVEWLVEKHQFLNDARQIRTSKLKQILVHPGFRELLALHRADALASDRSTEHVDYCERLLQEWTDADLNPPPLLTGHDLMRRGLERGPLYKRLLDAVREGQLEGTLTTPKEAMDLVDRLVAEERTRVV
jgi:poly(A) polymerase